MDDEIIIIKHPDRNSDVSVCLCLLRSSASLSRACFYLFCVSGNCMGVGCGEEIQAQRYGPQLRVKLVSEACSCFINQSIHVLSLLSSSSRTMHLLRHTESAPDHCCENHPSSSVFPVLLCILHPFITP